MQDTIKINLRETGCAGEVYIQLARDGIQRLAVVNRILTVRFHGRRKMPSLPERLSASKAFGLMTLFIVLNSK